MESQELRIFQAVAKAGSITKAAQVLGYVQSNVTARIQQLESELNRQLFYRQRGMVLTPDGAKLLRYAEKITHLLDEAHMVMNDSGEPAGPLLLGATHTSSANYLPAILAEYSKLYPKVELALTTDYSDVLVEKVRRFELHGAFVKTENLDDHFVQEMVMEEQLVLIASADVKHVEEVYHKPFLMNTKGCPHRERLEEWMGNNGINKIRYLEFNNPDAIIQGVISGLGASFVVKSSIQELEKEGKLRSFNIPEEYSSAKKFFIRHKDSVMTSTMSTFIDLLKKSVQGQ
ncbi:LysR family transcriptional regulator [Falsibacillus pallidus]|uniref:DNA-binding transcriptional LysR family regulator n=1 Tax=Falsibacillus pallidus TaxID=493781 RepID=A0A370GCJ1_9BACI|nr:LysR family transcriptional regulator [Falsibacillus pallidus]RDI40930.1 DNA-binding transcriptional LysR family regulator [Falsibacillus pallidus]